MIFQANFDLGAQNPAPSSYHPGGPGDVLPAGSTSAVYSGTAIALPPGYEGGQALALTNGAAAPVRQGYNFWGLTNADKLVQNSYTVEAIVRASFADAVYNGTNYGKTTKAYILHAQPQGSGWGDDSSLWVDQTTRKVGWGGIGGFGDMTSITALEDGRWYHIAVVVNGSGVVATQAHRMYINNIDDAVGPYPIGWETAGLFFVSPNVFVGCTPDSTSNNFASLVDAVAISDTALTPGSFVLPTVTPAMSGVCFQVNFDLAAQSPAPGIYYNPTLTNDIIPPGCSGLRLDTNNAIVLGGGMQGKGALAMTGGAAAPSVQGYKFWNASSNKLVQNTFTLEAIVKPDFSDAIVGGTNYGKASTSYILANAFPGMSTLYVDQQTGQVHYRGYDTWGDIDSSMTLTNGQWYHIAVVVDGGTLQTRMYINGQHKGTGSYPDGWQTLGIFQMAQHLFVGSYDGSTTGKNFCGQIDAVAISDTARGINNFVLPYRYPPAGTIVKVR